MAEEESGGGLEDGESNIVSRIGPVEVDWPRTVGFYGGLALAVSLEMIAPPLAIFIGAYPLLKLLNQPNAPGVVRVVSQVLEGAAQPVGGDAEGSIRMSNKGGAKPAPKAKIPAKAKPARQIKAAPKARPPRARAIPSE